jgi:hypothetical protein
MIPLRDLHPLLLDLLVLAFAGFFATPPFRAVAQGAPAVAPSPAAVSPQTKSNGPRIQFAAPAHDFGKVRGGEIKKHDFVFTNTGTAILEVTEVRRTCGCTAAGEWTKRVAPGETGLIPIEFHSANDRGTIAKTVTVVCNASGQSNVVLHVKAEIWRPVELEPQAAMIKAASDSSTNVVATVKILNRMEAPMVITEARSSHKTLASRLKETIPGKEYELTVNVVPPLGLGNVYGKITLQTSLAEAPTVEVPVYVLLQPALEITPRYVSLPAGPFTNPVSRVITIRSLASSPLVLTEPTFSLAGVVAELKETQAGKLYGLTLTFPVAFSVGKGVNAEARVKSNYPDTPILRIPVVTQAPPSTPGSPPTLPRTSVKDPAGP